MLAILLLSDLDRPFGQPSTLLNQNPPNDGHLLAPRAVIRVRSSLSAVVELLLGDV